MPEGLSFGVGWHAVSALPDHTGWVSCGNCQGWNVSCDYTPRTNDAAVAEPHAWHDDHSGTDPDVIADDHRSYWQITLPADGFQRIFEGVCRGHDYHVRSHHDIISDLRERSDSGVLSDLGIVADFQATARAYVGSLLDDHAGTAVLGNDSHQFSAKPVAELPAGYRLGRKSRANEVVNQKGNPLLRLEIGLEI